MTSNNEQISRPTPKKYCALCMGMMFFASNTSHWEVDTCDSCGQVARVKAQSRGKLDDKNIQYQASTRYRLTQQNKKEKEHKGLFKKIDNVLDMFSL